MFFNLWLEHEAGARLNVIKTIQTLRGASASALRTAVAVFFVNIKAKLSPIIKLLQTEKIICLKPETAAAEISPSATRYYISPSATRYYRIMLLFEARFIVSPSWEISVGKKKKNGNYHGSGTNGVLQSLFEKLESR